MIYFETKNGVMAFDADQVDLIEQARKASWIERTQAEAASLLKSRHPGPSPQEVAQAQINELELKFLLARPVREGMLGLAEKEAIEVGAALGLTPQQSLAKLAAEHEGYMRMKALDTQIAQLRQVIRA